MNSEVDSYADLILLTLTKYASRLEEFRFGPKPLLSDDGLCVFVEECPKLRVLDIHGCPTITHQSLGNFGKLAKKLEILNVSECPGLTFQALTGLAGCSSLKEIHGCRIPSSFSTTKEEVLQTLFEDIPSLDRVYYTLDNGQDTVRHRWDQISR